MLQNIKSFKFYIQENLHHLDFSIIRTFFLWALEKKKTKYRAVVSGGGGARGQQPPLGPVELDTSSLWLNAPITKLTSVRRSLLNKEMFLSFIVAFEFRQFPRTALICILLPVWRGLVRYQYLVGVRVTECQLKERLWGETGTKLSINNQVSSVLRR